MRVLLTGIAGRLGRLVAAHLHEAGHQVFGLDPRGCANLPAGVTHFRVDLRRQAAAATFAQVAPEAVVHLGVVHNFRIDPKELLERNVHGTEELLRLAIAHGVGKLVLLSSGDVYGPSPANSHFLTEEAPLLASVRFPQVRTLVAVDRTVQAFFWRFPAVQTVILRPAHIVGPNVRNAPSNYLRLRRIPTQMGFDPMLQLTSEHDVCRALAQGLVDGCRGVFNVASTEPVPLSYVLAQVKKPTLPLPHPLFAHGLRQLWKLGLTSFPPPELDHIRFNTVLDTTRAQQILFVRPTADLAQLLEPFCAAPKPSPLG